VNNNKLKILILAMAGFLIVGILATSFSRFDKGESITATIVETVVETENVEPTYNENTTSTIPEKPTNPSINEVVFDKVMSKLVTVEEYNDENITKYEDAKNIVNADVIYGFPSKNVAPSISIEEFDTYDEMQGLFVKYGDFLSHDVDQGEISPYKMAYIRHQNIKAYQNCGVMRYFCVNSELLPKECRVEKDKVVYDSTTKTIYVVLKEGDSNSSFLQPAGVPDGMSAEQIKEIKSTGFIMNLMFDTENIDKVEKIVIVIPKQE
jgi:hypothetical protein